MVRTLDLLPGRQWLLPVLVVLLVLGHACELPAYADLAMSRHAAAEAHHSADRHGNGELISCDAVGVVSSLSYSAASAGLDVSVEPPVIGSPPVRVVVARSPEGGADLTARPPLFLLFASFLI